ncbi:flagellar protein FlgN [Anaeroarcus burkinensis]|uniref:flagellar protein FlgN n=1 Tax=Anaeroarcus burkinensis TaxID=82376 RepID=UPI0004059E69|nr:flagellar protein FlgN [Anaeroarcus burkinensis]
MELWDELQQILDELLQIYQALLQCGEEKKQLLLSKPEPAELEVLVKREEELLLQAGMLEQKKQRTSRALAKQHGRGDILLPLFQLVLLAPAYFIQDRIKDWARQVSPILKALQEINAMNGRFLEQASQFVQYQINLFSQVTTEINYAPEGQKTKAYKFEGRG